MNRAVTSLPKKPAGGGAATAALPAAAALSGAGGGGRITPVRRQWLTIKHSYPDAILLFRMGDFYECFDEDAHTLAAALEIALTARPMGKGYPAVPLAGIPVVSLDANLARLIRQGYKVAICEQLSDPAASRGIVERGVVRVVTPGTVLESALLDHKANNYLAAVCPDDGAGAAPGNRTGAGAGARSEAADAEVGLAYVDVTTGEFAVAQLPASRLPMELARLEPSETLVPAGDAPPDLGIDAGTDADIPLTTVDAAAFQPEVARRALLGHYGILSLEAYGLEEHGAVTLPLAVRAAGAIIDYLRYTYQGEHPTLLPPAAYRTDAYMTLDPQTRRNLELFAAGRWDSRELSLFAALDDTRTAMGARLLRRWLGRPLLERARVERRLDVVQYFYDDAFRRADASAALAAISDLERILSRIQTNTAAPRDLLALRRSLEAAERLGGVIGTADSDTDIDADADVDTDTDADDDGDSGVPDAVRRLAAGLRPLPALVGLIDDAISPEPAGPVGDGSVIRAGFSAELDAVRSIASDTRAYIAGLETAERERTGIRNLKIGYNQVFGYYIEVSRTNLGAVPPHYQRRQTLTNGERYITPELKEYENRALDARERLQELERALYRQVCGRIAEHGAGIARLAAAVARADVCHGLASVAVRHDYVRPEVDDGTAIAIVGGRHPVVERVLEPGAFVSNDAALDADDAQIMLITGPNMAGKSTYIRQVAIITLLAQMGSFVPAAAARIGIVDRIFTRVGLQDDLATGQSTFMVEMVETAAILNQAGPRSLVVLDEIGRGTSTYDGLAIARAVVEHLHDDPRRRCRTLFATHYHELTDLAATLPGVRNYRVAVSEEDGQIAFLRRIVPGGADRSYGVHVAMLAGMPPAVVGRAQELLSDLEEGNAGGSLGGVGSGGRRGGRRGGRHRDAPLPQLALPLFGGGSGEQLAEALRELDIANLTPLDAINKLYELQEQARRSED